MAPRLDMIGIVTSSMSESLRFYRMLGITISDPAPDELYVETTLTNGLRISWNALDMVKQIDPEWQAPTGHRTSMAFLCDSPAAVDETFSAIKGAGFHSHKEPWDAFWGQRYAVVIDPDGNLVDLFAPLG